MDKPHNFSCEYCHLWDKKISSNCKFNVIKNPSDLKFAEKKCRKCHKKDIEKVKRSLMSTNAGIINITRYLWFEQNSPIGIYSTINVGFLRRINDKKLVDDFLRKVCLRCHINTDGAKRYGEFRSSGCASCHIIYENDGTHEHKFTKNIPVFQCLHCHNFNRVGFDYAGFFEHDYNKVYDSPIGNKKFKRIYGEYQHRLVSDVHFRKGLKCIDCHKKNEVMGDGKIYSFEYQQVKIRCIHCHKKSHKIKIYHKKLECFSCHSVWGAQDYGLHVVREDYEGYFRWRNLKNINVPDTQKILHEIFKNYEKKISPYITDYIDNRKKLGVWYILWSYRRWSDPVLGINQRGKISPVRPEYQYYVTWIDKEMNVKMNSEKMGFGWSSYFPHTVTKYGRSCYSCHFNLKSLGLGYGMIEGGKKIINMYDLKKDGFKIDFPLEKIIDVNGKSLQKFVIPDTSPLKIKIIKKMLMGYLK